MSELGLAFWELFVVLGDGIISARMGDSSKASIIGSGRCFKIEADMPENDV